MWNEILSDETKRIEEAWMEMMKNNTGGNEWNESDGEIIN